jgi:hypothetical protein
MRKQQIGWKRETDSARERKREREKKKIRSQDLKLAGVRWLYWRPEFLAGAVRLLLKYWSLTFDRVTDSLIFNMDSVNNALGRS